MDYEKMSLDELKEYAKSIGLSFGKIGKDKLIEKIKEKDAEKATVESVFTDDDLEEKKDENISFSDASEHVEGYAAFITENPYREELNSFLKQIADPTYVPAWDFEKDKAVLDWITVIEA